MKNVFVSKSKTQDGFYKTTIILNNEGTVAQLVISSEKNAFLVDGCMTFADFIKAQGYEEVTE